jgi:hypothetical protein
VHPLQGQTDGSRRVPDLSCKQVGENSPSHFYDYLTCALPGVRLCIVVKEKDVCHVSVRTNCADALQFFTSCLISASVRLLSAVTAVAGRPLRVL